MSLPLQSPGRGHLGATVAAVLVPVLYVCYYRTYLFYQTLTTQYSWAFEVESLWGFTLSMLLLATVGAGLAVTWERGLRLPTVLAAVELLALPWGFPFLSPGAAGTHLVWVAVSVAVGAGLETVARSPEALDRRSADEWVRFGIAVGVLHVSVAVALHLLTRASPVWPRSAFGLAVWLAALAGTGLTGFLPAYAWTRLRLRAPAVALCGWLCWAGVRVVTHADRLPVTESTSIRHTAVRPFPDYALQWPVLLLVVVLAAAAEYSLTRRSASAAP